MKEKLRFLLKNKHRFTALFVLLIMVFNSCSNPLLDTDSDFTPDFNPDDFNPMYFYVDENGNFSEMDLGRTVLIADEKQLDVVFYSDDASIYQRVGMTFEDKSIIFIFEDDQNFPTSIVFSDSEDTINGFFTSYDPVTQTFSLLLVQDGDSETLSNIFLSKDIFTHHKDDPELSPSQNMRMRNLYIAMCIFLSLDEFVDSYDELQAARFFKWLAKKVSKVLPKPLVYVTLGVVAVALAVTTVASGGAAGVVYGLAKVVVPVTAAKVVALCAAAYSLVNGIEMVIEGIGEQITGPPVVAPGLPFVAVTGISLDRSSANINIGSTVTLIPTVTPANATNRLISWSSSNSAVATVGINGIVTGRSTGTTTITVTTQDGSRTAIATVFVNIFPVTGITLNKATTSILVGGTETLITTITPTNATNRNVNWSSSNTAVATVSSNGTITGHSVGTATITVTTVDGSRTASCIVTVNPVPVTGVLLDRYSFSLGIGDTAVLVSSITPANAANKNVTWSSSNTAVATVSSNGTVTGQSIGSAIITVTTVDGGKTATCTVSVTASSFLYYWVDAHNNLATSGTTTISQGGTISITAQAAGYTVRQWHLNGVNTGQSGNTYIFSGTVRGNHTVGLFVEKDGRLYNTNIAITVQ